MLILNKRCSNINKLYNKVLQSLNIFAMSNFAMVYHITLSLEVISVVVVVVVVVVVAVVAVIVHVSVGAYGGTAS